jgi:hypothetical protein
MSDLAMCPVCDYEFSEEITNLIKQENYCTTDCIGCSALLLIKDGKLYDFHKYLHEQDARWPKDGKDIGFIQI